jgi:hypothetical protein
MHRPRVLSIGCLLALIAPPAVSGAQSDSRLWPPAVVADSFFAATHDARWSDAARFLDLEAVATMRDGYVRMNSNQKPPRKLTAEFFLQSDSTMPRAVAEYQARRFNETTRPTDLVAYEYARVPSVDSLAHLSPADAAARWLEARDERWVVRLGMLESRNLGCMPVDSIEAFVAAMRPPAEHVVGTVVDDSIAYVLHGPARGGDAMAPRTAPDSVRPSRAGRRRGAQSYLVPPAITTLRRVGAAWRIVPTPESQVSLMGVSCVSQRRRNGR